MTQEDRERVIKVVADKLGKPVEQVRSVETLDDLGADSLDVVEVIMGLEEEFVESNVSIPDEDVPGLKSIDAIVEYIDKQLST